MKMSEILRDLSDKLAAIEQGQGNMQSTKSMGGTPVEAVPGDNGEGEVMVPPLQMKLELLKKASGVPSHFDEEAAEGTDELAQVKKNAGLSTVIQHEAGEDNDIVG